jgi:hypothetical protein
MVRNNLGPLLPAPSQHPPAGPAPSQPPHRLPHQTRIDLFMPAWASTTQITPASPWLSPHAPWTPAEWQASDLLPARFPAALLLEPLYQSTTVLAPRHTIGPCSRVLIPGRQAGLTSLSLICSVHAWLLNRPGLPGAMGVLSSTMTQGTAEVSP